MLHVDGKPVFPEGKPGFRTLNAMLYRKGDGQTSRASSINVDSAGKIQVFPYPEKNILVFMTEDGKEGIVCQLPWDIENRKTIDITLKPTAQATFQLLDKETKQPIADAMVRGSLVGRIDQQRMVRMYNRKTDAHGNVSISMPALENIEGLQYKIDLECIKTARLETDWISPQTPGETLDFGQRYLDGRP